MSSELAGTVKSSPNKYYPSWHLHYRTKPCKFFEKGNCRYGKRCRFFHDQQSVPGITELLNRLQVATILTGIKLEDVKEIIKNQNELIKEQAAEIAKLKTSLDYVLTSHSNITITTKSTTNKHTQCHIPTSDKYSNTDDSLPLAPKENEDEIKQKESCALNFFAEKPLLDKPTKVQFEKSLCKFFLQGNCLKRNKCNFAHEEISAGDILEYNDHCFNNRILPAKFLGFSHDSDGFSMRVQLLTKTASIVIDSPYWFRKKK
jgi:hypothetical protein